MPGSVERLTSLWKGKPGLKGVLGTVDHKKIGKRYIITAFAFLIAGGLLAALMRWQLAGPNRRVLTPEAYDQVFTMHGVTMIFWYASPILSGIAVYVVPLMIGARDMAYPRLNAFTYWVFLASGIFLFLGLPFGQAPDAGWFAYTPFSERRYSPGLGMDLYALSLIFLTISTTGGAINLIATILRHRAPGMSLSKMPLMLYSTLTASIVTVFALPSLTVACTFLELQRQWHFHFFDLSHGGDPVLWQHLFWFFGHPWVYVIFLPATGFISMILPVFCRRPIVGYRWVAAATVLTGTVGFSVWLHHMFANGGHHGAMSFFSAASMVLSVFSAIQFAAWLATMVKGRIVFATPMLYCIGFLASFAIGGLSGVIVALIPLDWQVTDSYFVVAHLHYVLIGANVFPVFAAIYYWYPKITGRMLNERLGTWSFVTMFVGFMLTFFPMHITGVLGMTRRIYTYGADRPWVLANQIETVGAAILTIGILLTIINVFISRSRGIVAGRNPWNADTLEWDTASPPPVYGTVHLPTVATLHPLWDEHDEEHDPNDDRVFDQERLTLTTHWKTAEPLSVAQAPDDSLWPLAATIGFFGVFTALLFKAVWIAIGIGVATGVTFAAWQWPKPIKRPEPPPADEVLPAALDQHEGSFGMIWLIATEATLFASLFVAYYFLGSIQPHWPLEKAPKMSFALVMLGILVASSVVLHWGEKRVELGQYVRARIAIALTLLLGVVFVVVQAVEYHVHLREMLPTEHSYASIFYTITSFHAAHLIVGLAMLGYVLFQPSLDPDRPPHKPLHAAAMYWHFVDAVWLVIVTLLYVVPNLRS
ncbi:MAG: cbb3-type cytochrome c oxidase subunit I [Deltaproteobacteria bacterium]|nr:cbb3-type cytochrome c oxidase subunit I [Deltaproteobacteria bacterium]